MLLRIVTYLFLALSIVGFPTDTVAALNDHRRASVTLDARLMAAAQERAEDIGAAGVIPYGHPGWAETVGRHYPVACAGEVISIMYDRSFDYARERGWDDKPENVIARFRASPAHWGVLTSPVYTIAGVGKAPYTGEWYDWVVVILVGSC